MIIRESALKMGRIVQIVQGLPGDFSQQPPLAHASSHETGADKIDELGFVEIGAFRIPPRTTAPTATVTIDLAVKADVWIEPLSANINFTWINAGAAAQGTIVVTNAGGWAVSFTPPVPWVLRRDSAVADLGAPTTGVTIYRYAFIAPPASAGLSIVAVSKIVAVLP